MYAPTWESVRSHPLPDWYDDAKLGVFLHWDYNAVPDGVINDRWVEPPGHRGTVTDALARAGGTLVQRLWPLIPDDRKSLTFSAAHHYDIRTPEYARFETIQDKKWKCTRGVGCSFGANRNERPEDIVTAAELIRSFVDIVSKNGNLLIGIGPDEHGWFPAEQLTPLRGLEGGGVRFTQRDGVVYAVLLEASAREYGIRGLDATAVTEVRLLGLDEPLTWSVTDGHLRVTMPEHMPLSPAYVLRLAGGARPAGPADQRGGEP